MVMRGDWLLREVDICITRQHLLVPLWRADQVTERYDTGARLMEIADKIVQGVFDCPQVQASPYDLWLDARLEDGRDATWLADHPLYAASTFCRLLGAALLRLSIADVQDARHNLRAAQAAGFEIAREGEADIHVTLDSLAARADGVQDQPQKAFGQLFRKLAHDYLNEDAFLPFRRILRECILANWPVGRGETVMGEVVPERRLHSLTSAALETGIGAGVLEQFLNEAGAFARADGKPKRKTFDAKRYAALLAEIPTLVGPIAMQEAMGATRSELVSLQRDGVLVPRTLVPGVKSPWRISDGLALVAKLEEKAHQVAANDMAWESIQLARKRTGVAVGAIITAIRAGQIEVGRRAGTVGNRGILVRIAETCE